MAISAPLHCHPMRHWRFLAHPDSASAQRTLAKKPLNIVRKTYNQLKIKEFKKMASKMLCEDCQRI